MYIISLLFWTGYCTIDRLLDSQFSMAALYAMPCPPWSRFDTNLVFHRSPSGLLFFSLVSLPSPGASMPTPPRNPPPQPPRSLPASASSTLTPMPPSHTTMSRITRHPPLRIHRPPRLQDSSSAGARSRKPKRYGVSCRTTDTTATTEPRSVLPMTTKTMRTRLRAC